MYLYIYIYIYIYMNTWKVYLFMKSLSCLSTECLPICRYVYLVTLLRIRLILYILHGV